MSITIPMVNMDKIGKAETVSLSDALEAKWFQIGFEDGMAGRKCGVSKNVRAAYQRGYHEATRPVEDDES